MKIVFGRCLLRKRLNEACIRQSELADLSSKTETQISDYISGRKFMSYRTAVEFSAILKCHAEDLYEWDWRG